MTERTSVPPDEQYVIGPDDCLVLVCRRDLTQAEAADMLELLPERLHGRVVVVDGREFDAYKVAAHAASERDS